MRICWGFMVLIFIYSFALASCSASNEIKDECGHTLSRPKGRWDTAFWKKFFKNLNPFNKDTKVKMQFYLYKHDFPECGREIIVNNDDLLEISEFNATHPTRVIIHGWMSQSKNNLNRRIKDAYLELTQPSNEASSIEDRPKDFNVIIADWSPISTNVNYFKVVEFIDDLGFLVANLMRYLNETAKLDFNDVYLIGHSLGAQISGSAGKQIKPFKFNTIFALDPAGPKFRSASDDMRIDSSDANYVESILTSETLGFNQPVGHASFYPNFGSDQKKCYKYGCSHSRAHRFFAESITSKLGFWGPKTERQSSTTWILNDIDKQYRMGGEPSTPKSGIFYVKTNDEPPYAIGKINYTMANVGQNV